MELNTFKTFVDEKSSSIFCTEINDHDDFLVKIRECFTFKESDEARLIINQIIDDLGLRYMCEQAIVDPYLGVAKTILQALRGRGNLVGEKSDWKHAVELASIYYANSQYNPPSAQAWSNNVRVNCLSLAINELRNLGYIIKLPVYGGVEISQSETEKLARDINNKAASLGHALALSISEALTDKYSPMSGRFNIGRNGQTIEMNPKPIQPLAYLYQLGLRYFTLEPSAPFPENVLNQLIKLVTWATALLDLSLGTFEIMFARNTDMVSIMQKSITYDSVFLLTQAKPTHAKEYLNWIMSQEQLKNLKDKKGRTSTQILAAATNLLNRGEKSDKPTEFIPISIQDVAYATSLGIREADAMLSDVFTHVNGANQSLTYPPVGTHVNAAFRPLLTKHPSFLFKQPAPMAARSTVNAALDWCRKNWRPDNIKSNFDDTVMGPLFENFVREKLKKHGVTVLHGKYEMGEREGQCDAIVETQESIIIFEIKSKLPCRQSRAGDTVAAMLDLSQSLILPQKQAMERHAVLQERGAILLQQGKSVKTITLGSREVFRISVTRGELGSLHDRPFLQQFLQSLCTCELISDDLTKKSNIDLINNNCLKFKNAAVRANELFLNKQFTFSTSWSFSVFQLMFLLERVIDNESFAKELQRNRHISTPLRDFYSEYEFLINLEQYKEQSS